MNDMNNTVIIDAEYFEKLVRDSEKLEMIKNMLLTSLSLSYRGEYLRIEDEKVIMAIRAIDDEAVIQKERYLMEEYAKEHEEDGADE